ncbi:D-alanine--D-alanine ligase family protein [Dokdonella sp.]|uniref:D-alanine--D-alanine ligase family protein n=1 Tax=Dokdonella sp. TaxID=2291710 RepID=UPI0031BDB723|nr:D-alanine--D-alanine ligase [Dokdonella sp.]
MKRLKILMLFGGESSEHDVSIKSAKNVYAAIDKHKHEVSLAYIDRDGLWWLLPSWADSLGHHPGEQLAVTPGSRSLRLLSSNEDIAVDVIFPVLHGKNGEDGTVQGLAEIAHIPIVGCDVESSAVCMDKDATKRLLESAGMPIVPWVTVGRDDDARSVLRRVKELHSDGPWFVKPSRAGSSVGVTKVTSADGLWKAITFAHEHDELALVEVAVSGRELEVGVLGNIPDHKASGVGEIIAGREFYDYEDKYSDQSASRIILKAQLPTALTKVIRQYATDAYRVLGCRGLARIDFLLSDELIPYINEVNTLPGFTDISMYPKLWNQKGMSYEALVDRLIMLALE